MEVDIFKKCFTHSIKHLGTSQQLSHGFQKPLWFIFLPFPLSLHSLSLSLFPCFFLSLSLKPTTLSLQFFHCKFEELCYFILYFGGLDWSDGSKDDFQFSKLSISLLCFVSRGIYLPMITIGFFVAPHFYFIF